MLALCALCLSAPGCVGPHGHSPEAWFTLLASGAELPLPDGREPDYKALSRLGEGALLFLSMHARDRGRPDLESLFLFASVEMESGLFQLRAAELLAARLSPRAEPEAALRFAGGPGGRLIAPEKAANLEAAALLALGRYKEAAERVRRYRTERPDDRENSSLAAVAAEALFALNDPSWTAEFRLLARLELERDQYEALGRLARLAGQGSDLGRAELVLATARSLSGLRDYGASVRAFRELASLSGQTIAPPAGLDALAAAATRLNAGQLVAIAAGMARPAYSDLARAFLYGSRDEGYDAFMRLGQAPTGAGALSLDPMLAYARAYWAGRFARESGAWDRAEAAFKAASTVASSQIDLDAALWYEVESAARQSIRRASSSLASALGRTANPAYYEDQLESLSRQALLAGDGTSLLALGLAADQAAPADRARLDYLCARAAMEGLISATDLRDAGLEAQAWIQSRLVRARDQGADSWYRLAAAFWIHPDSVRDTALKLYEVRSESLAYGPADERLAYARGLARFGLYARLRTEPGIDADALPQEILREAAVALAGREAWADSIRLAGLLVRRAGGAGQDGSLFWPRPWPQLFETAAADSGLPMHILYALARSESLFQPAVVSSAGAVGLTQLMPATAEEQAARLRLSGYELTEPEDNLRLGSSYLKRMLDAVDGRLLEAVYAYNAGLSRTRSWKARARQLPQDLLLETLEYAETRQYGRNVASAAVMYATLYGYADPAELMAEIMGASF